MRAAFALTAGLVLGVTMPAEAQFGKITQKAQQAITKDTQPKKVTCAPQFDDVVIELKDDVLTRVAAGLRASRNFRGRDGMTSEELMRRSVKATEERNALMEGRDKDLERYNERVNQHSGCMNDALSQAHDERQEAMGRLLGSMGASDPQLMQDIQRLSLKQHERLAAGDTAGAQQAADSMMKRLGMDPKADTAKAIAKCGRDPAKPAWLAMADSLGEASNTLLWEARGLDQGADSVGARAAGLSAPQFFVAKERVATYVFSEGQTGMCFTDTERTALRARLSELKGLFD